MRVVPPDCPYCGKPSRLMRDSSSIYHGRNYGPVWICDPCYAWVGCHRDTIKPLGRLANAELRKAKIAAHNAFDPLWKAWRDRATCGARAARSQAYLWLAAQLSIDRAECHIGMFDVAMCQRVVEVCTIERKRAA